MLSLLVFVSRLRTQLNKKKKSFSNFDLILIPEQL